MDVPTRSSYVMAVVTEESVPLRRVLLPCRGASRLLLSPVLAGAMIGAAFQARPLVICGLLKIRYDLLLLLQFRHVKPPEESEEGGA